jgi:transposase
MRSGISIKITRPDRRRLEAITKDRNSSQKHVWRAAIVLLSADDVGTNEIMRQTGTSKTCVWRWQQRFMEEGVDGLLQDKTRPSRIPGLGPEVAERVVALTLADPPTETTHWTADLMARASGISASAVRRIWKAHGLQPHRCRQFKLSNDPDFVAKLRDVVGLYVDPPAHAIVLSVDEKSQIQALDRTQPGLPLKKGRLGTMTHDYKRHGTTTLFAALNVLDGTVIGRNMQRHRHQELIRFLNTIEAEVPVPQASERSCLARSPSAFHLPLHANLVLLAQRRRGVLRQAQPASAEARCLSFRRRSTGRYQPLRLRDQRRPKALHMDRQPRQNHRRRQKRAPSVRFNPLGRRL